MIKSMSDTSYGPLVPGLGMVISLILHLHSPKRIKLVQQMNSIQMFKAGVSQKVFQVFGKLGICMGLTGTRLLADRLISGFDDDIMSLKRNIECELSDSDNLQVQALEGSCNPVTTQVRQRLFEADDSNCVGVQPLQEEQCPGYSLCWDNIQTHSIARYQSTLHQNKFLMWALSFATVNRVSFRHLDDLDSEPTQRASDIDLERFLPTVYDWNLLRVRMELLVTRIICKHMEYFSSLKEEIQGFISHPYIKESTEKSTIFNLGIIKENPASNKGVVAIMKNLKKYVPQRGPGDPYRVLCHGDQLSAERMVEGRQAMASSENPFDRLIGLEPNCQDFHERCIILQDTMNILYDGKSADNEGSLFHLKTIFQHRNVRKNISDCINHVDSLLNFTTEALVVLAAMKLLNIGGIDDIPDNAPDQSEDRQQHLKTLAAKLLLWFGPTLMIIQLEKLSLLKGMIMMMMMIMMIPFAVAVEVMLTLMVDGLNALQGVNVQGIDGTMYSVLPLTRMTSQKVTGGAVKNVKDTQYIAAKETCPGHSGLPVLVVISAHMESGFMWNAGVLQGYQMMTGL
ncbi:uncharacterized protein [Ptychodera flava]|uniref:uncharacterized protein isoform X1 n=1 Tax=Ptychodera flava TaxID=63121 RepID=UPI00396A9C05